MSNYPVDNRQQYSDELKKQVVRDSDIIGCKAASAKYNVPLPTVYFWRSKIQKQKKGQPKNVRSLEQTIEKTLKEINRVLNDGPGDSKPHEWLGKLTDQVDKLLKLYQTLQGQPATISQQQAQHVHTVDDRIAQYLTAIQSKQVLDAEVTSVGE